MTLRPGSLVGQASAIALFMTSLGLHASDIRSYGATGDGVSDDTMAIQKAINATPIGGVLTFPAGTYKVTSPLLFRSDRTYQGQDSPVLLGHEGRGPAAYFLVKTEHNRTRNIAIDGITFDGGGIAFEGQEIPAEHVRFTNNTVRNIVNSSSNWVLRRGIYIPSGMRGSTIAGNSFSNIQWAGLADLIHTDGSAIAGWRVDQTAITDNRFDSVNQGISLQFDSIPANPGPFGNVVIARNVGTNVHRMGIETQSTTAACNNMLVEDNSFSSYRNPYNDSFGYSIVHGGSGTIIRRNTAIATPAPPPGHRFGFAFEVAGDSVTISENLILSPMAQNSKIRWWAGIIMGHGSNFVIRNNTICGSPAGSAITFEVAPHPSATVSENVIDGASCASIPGMGQ